MIPVLVLVFYLLPLDVRYLAAAFVFSIALCRSGSHPAGGARYDLGGIKSGDCHRICELVN